MSKQSSCLITSADAKERHMLHTETCRSNLNKAKQASKPSGTKRHSGKELPTSSQPAKAVIDFACRSLPLVKLRTPTQCCHRIGTPCFCTGGLTACPPSSSPFPSTSSILVSLFKKLLSFTGLPLCPLASGPLVPLVPPLLPVLGAGLVK